MSDAIQRRNFILVAVAALANFYLLIFSADALLSIVEELFRGVTGSDALLGIRGLVALVAVLVSAVMIPVLVFVPHLPKRAFVPLILFALWRFLVRRLSIWQKQAFRSVSSWSYCNWRWLCWHLL